MKTHYRWASEISWRDCAEMLGTDERHLGSAVFLSAIPPFQLAASSRLPRWQCLQASQGLPAFRSGLRNRLHRSKHHRLPGKCLWRRDHPYQSLVATDENRYQIQIGNRQAPQAVSRHGAHIPEQLHHNPASECVLSDHGRQGFQREFYLEPLRVRRHCELEFPRSSAQAYSAHLATPF
ncbi:hypothetical protein D9M69_565980 [compost metagenome]